MPHSAVSDLSLCCLPVSLLRDVRLKWVKQELSLSFVSGQAKVPQVLMQLLDMFEVSLIGSLDLNSAQLQ